MEERLLVTATLGKTHGYEGFLRVYPSSGETEHLKKLKKCLVKCRNGKQVAVSVCESRTHADSFLMKFATYDTKEKASVLSGGVMYVRYEEASPLKEGEYYVADLFGLKMIHTDGSEVGEVVALCDGAQADYLEVKKSDGKTLLIPNMEVFVSKPDFESGTITLFVKELAEL